MFKKDKSLKTILFLPNDQRVNFSGHATVLELAHKNKVDLSSSCGGMGSCGTCRIKIEDGLNDLPPRNDIEKEMAEDRGFEPNERLACQTVARHGLKIRIPG